VRESESQTITTYYGVGGPSRQELSDLENALVRIEESAKRYVTETRRARADAYAAMYSAFGSDPLNDITDYYGYLAGEIPSSDVDDSIRRELDPKIADRIERDIALDIYNFHQEMVSEISPSVSESEVSQVVFEFLMGTHSGQNNFLRVDGQTFAELRDELATTVANRRADILETLGSRTGIEPRILDSLIQCLTREADQLDRCRQEFVDEVRTTSELLKRSQRDDSGNRITGYISPVQADAGTQGGVGSTNGLGGVTSAGDRQLAVDDPGAYSLALLGLGIMTGGALASGALTTKGLLFLGGVSLLGGTGMYLSATATTAGTGTAIVGAQQTLTANQLVHSAFYYNLYYSGLTTLNSIGRSVQSLAIRQLKREIKEKLIELANSLANQTLQEVIERLCRQDQVIQEIDVSDIGPLDAITTGGELTEARQSGSVEIKNVSDQPIVPHLGGSYITSQGSSGTETTVGRIEVEREELQRVPPGETTTIEFSYVVPVGFLCGRYRLNLVGLFEFRWTDLQAVIP